MSLGEIIGEIVETVEVMEAMMDLPGLREVDVSGNNF